MKKIAITGTKGKTTVSNILTEVLCKFESKVLSVNTNGAYLDGNLMISKAQSLLMWNLYPTVAPGRFLYLLHDLDPSTGAGISHSKIDSLVIFESSLGSGTFSGMGYYDHDIGVFTNVFEDHIGSRSDLSCRQDLGNSKKFVFSRINCNGYAVFNADDDIICSNLDSCKKGVTKIPFGFDFEHFNLKKHLAMDGMAITVDEKSVLLLSGKEKTRLFDISDITWTFNGNFKPSIYNLLAIVGALLGYGKGYISNEMINALIASRLDPDDGRLVLLKTDDNVSVIADFAHEKQSLKSVSELAHKLKKSDSNKVIGVLRLTWDRSEDLIIDTAKYIADSYDSFIIYDKIDGYWHKPLVRLNESQYRFSQETGKVSKLLQDTLLERRSKEDVTRILREDEAIAEAAKQALPGDVVVVIVNDDIKRSIEFIKTFFGAELV